ncbi:MAG: Eco57I restriction-modification methylase domain-containing protein [Thermomicrobiales bacterium]
MAQSINDQKLKLQVSAGNFDALFDELLWDNPVGLRPTPITIHGRNTDTDAAPGSWILQPVRQKRGVAIFTCESNGTLPDMATRRRIGRELQKTAHEHLIIFHTRDFADQVWFWTYREPGKPARPREIEFHTSENAAHLLSLLRAITFDFASEGTLVLTDVTDALNRIASPDRVTRRFYDEFSKQRDTFMGFIDGMPVEADRKWYAALMLNRLMFTWFLQAKGFLDNDREYLLNRLTRIERGELSDTTFHEFYKGFLRTLFHGAFATPESQRQKDIRAQLGKIPYINGGIFEQHQLELDNTGIDIPNEAFTSLFAFFGQYTWHLDDRPLGSENEINPDVLGYIFEKYVNQKKKGAYYTKGDVTGYISQNTIIPWLLEKVSKDCHVAFDINQPNNAWNLLKETPERYIYGSMRHGVIDSNNTLLPMPDSLVAGEHDIAQRGNWNQRAREPYALPTETWREYFHRRKRTLDLREQLKCGQIHEVDDLITLNLDIRQFASDVVEYTGGVDLIRAFWKAIRDITILDPTVGSGAFLFAAVKVVEPLYSGLLQRMQEELEHASGAALGDFRKVLDEASKHPNRQYFVLRQIILNNLYGVDIEEEAVEICKLRLFLLLAAQLEEGKAIEPLPDIDFNIRAGNTLVGYATREEVTNVAKGSNVSQGMLALDDSVTRIDEEAEQADKALQHFKAIQQDDMDSRADLRNAKDLYQKRLNKLRAELDSYLHRQQRVSDSQSLWSARTQPFHWFAEFHTIMKGNGGFEVIIGNPPYVRASEVRKQYVLKGFKTEKCPDIYAMVLERASNLLTDNGRSGMIVPLSLSFSGDFDALRRTIAATYHHNWFSSFGRIPSALFSHDVRVRNTIHIGRKGSPNVTAWSTRTHRWSSGARESLLETLDYGNFIWGSFEWIIPKFNGGYLSNHIALLERKHRGSIERLTMNSASGFPVHFPATSYNWTTFSPRRAPAFDLIGSSIPQTKWKTFYANNESDLAVICLLLSGSIGFAYWCAMGDDFDVTKGQMLSLPLPPLTGPLSTAANIQNIFLDFTSALSSVTNYKLNAGKKIGRYDIIRLRHITDRSDAIFKGWLGMTDEMWEEVLLLNAQMVKTDFDIDEG